MELEGYTTFDNAFAPVETEQPEPAPELQPTQTPELEPEPQQEVEPEPVLDSNVEKPIKEKKNIQFTNDKPNILALLLENWIIIAVLIIIIIAYTYGVV